MLWNTNRGGDKVQTFNMKSKIEDIDLGIEIKCRKHRNTIYKPEFSPGQGGGTLTGR